MSKQNEKEVKVEDIQISVCGGGGVGKSCISIQYISYNYNDIFDPTIEETYQKKIKIDETIINLHLVDTAGQEEFKPLRPFYMRKSDGFLMVYDVTNFKSLNELDEFYTEIERCKDDSPFSIVLCGNKSDIEDRGKSGVDSKTGKDWAKKYQANFIETSAKERKNIDESFEILLRMILKQRKVVSIPPAKKGVFSSVSSTEKEDLEDFDEIMKNSKK
eukprot:gene10114-2533_t